MDIYPKAGSISRLFFDRVMPLSAVGAGRGTLFAVSTVRTAQDGSFAGVDRTICLLLCRTADTMIIYLYHLLASSSLMKSSRTRMSRPVDSLSLFILYWTVFLCTYNS